MTTQLIASLALGALAAAGQDIYHQTDFPAEEFQLNCSADDGSSSNARYLAPGDAGRSGGNLRRLAALCPHGPGEGDNDSKSKRCRR